MKLQYSLYLCLAFVAIQLGYPSGNGVSGLRMRRKSDVSAPKRSARAILDNAKKSKTGIMQGYYGSWSSQGVSGRLLKDTNPLVSLIYVSFARIDLQYDIHRPFDARQNFLLKKHGLEFYNFAGLMYDMACIRKARPDVMLIISLGGETYMIDIEKEADYIKSIAKFVEDFDFDGIDIDWEPHSTFDMLNTLKYSEYYIKLIEEIRKEMPAEKLISISGSSNAALSCFGARKAHCTDDENPYNNARLEAAQEENPGLFLAGNMESAGTFINIFNKAGDKIDLVFIQTYNLSGVDPKVMEDMYLSHLFYGLKYDITVILGFSLEKDRGSFPADNANLLKLVGETIKAANEKNNRADGVGVWHLFMGLSENTAANVDTFFKASWSHINAGKAERVDKEVVENSDDCELATDYIYGLVIPTEGRFFKHNDCIWKNLHYSMIPPGTPDARYEWALVKPCYEKACNGKAFHYYNTNYENGSIIIWKGEAYELKYWAAGPPSAETADSYRKLEPQECPDLEEWNKKHPHKDIEQLKPYVQEK